MKLGTSTGNQKTRMMGLPGRQRSLLDRHRATAKTALTNSVTR